MVPVSKDSDCVMASDVVVRFSRLAVISLFSCGDRLSISVNNNSIVCLKYQNFTVQEIEPRCEKTGLKEISDLVRHKLVCTPTEDS